MTRWAYEFNRHPIHDALKSAKKAINVEIRSIGPEHMAERVRLNKVLDRFSAFVGNMDSDFYQHDFLDEIYNTLQGINFEQYAQNPIEDTLRSINDHFSRTIPSILSLYDPVSVSKYKDSIKIAENEKNEYFTLKGKIKEQIESSNDVIRSMNSFHEKAMNKEYDIFLKNVKKKKELMEEKYYSILEIHQMVAEEGVAAGYKKHAENERKSAQTWRFITMVLYCFALVWPIYRIESGTIFSSDGAFNWPQILAALSVTTVAVLIAQFTAQQSRLHRINEQQMRWFSLEVKAIDPFIQSLPDSERHSLKRLLSERLFAKDRVMDGRSGSRSVIFKRSQKGQGGES